MKYIRKLLKLPKFAVALLLLGIFYFIETFLMVVYLGIEYPLSFLLKWTEKIIKYLIKTI